MRIRVLLLGTIFGLFAGRSALAQVAASDSARPESIERLFVVSDMERTHAQALEATMADQMKANPLMAQYGDVIKTFTNKHSSFAALKPDLVRIYRQTYSEAEIQELIAFMQTDFGRRFIAKATALSRLTIQVTSERMRLHLPELTAAMQAAMSRP